MGSTSRADEPDLAPICVGPQTAHSSFTTGGERLPMNQSPSAPATRGLRLVVLIPFLNEELHLGTLLDSIDAQARPPDRLLLVDDGSTDRSGEIALAFARTHP